jgi:hypothetical protein
MSKNFGYYKKQINSLETNLNNASTTLTNKINTVNTNLISLDNRTKTVETEITPIARGGTSANGAEQACVNLGAIGYRTGLSSGLSGISGFFWADSSSGIPTNQIPSGYEGYDWSIIQFAAKTGVDKTQIFSNAGELFIRGDDTGNGGETWTQSSWKKLRYVQDIYVSGTTGYRIWNDGFKEQWGTYTNTSTSGTITLATAFQNTNYYVGITQMGNNTDTGGWGGGVALNPTKTTTTFTYSVQEACKITWYACGY